MSKILITYLTETNTTKEIAEAIGNILTENKLTVDILPVKEVVNMDEYIGVIVGAPINGMKWVQKATDFVEKNQSILITKKVALYFSSYLVYDTNKMWQKIIKSSLNKLKEKVNATNIGMFGGKIQDMFPTVPRLIFGIKKDTPLDTRNWDDIRKWANELVPF